MAYRFKNFFFRADGASYGFAFKGPQYDGVEVVVGMSRIQQDFRGPEFFPTHDVHAVVAPGSRAHARSFVVPEALAHLYMVGHLINDHKRKDAEEGLPLPGQQLLVNVSMI